MLSVDSNSMPDLPNLFNKPRQKQFRIISSIYPPIHFFEDLVDPSEIEILWKIEGLTNERLRQDVGELFLVSYEDRVAGPGSSVVMAAFTHLSKPTRFSDGSYGVYHAGLSKETAIRETVYHRENFLKNTNEPPLELSMALYEGKTVKPLHDIRDKKYELLHHPDSYQNSQVFGKKIKAQKSWGLIYNSVRHSSGFCIAVFRPPAISIPKQISHLKYIWDGNKITEVLDTQTILKF
jgi:hypothetical protein